MRASSGSPTAPDRGLDPAIAIPEEPVERLHAFQPHGKPTLFLHQQIPIHLPLCIVGFDIQAAKKSPQVVLGNEFEIFIQTRIAGGLLPLSPMLLQMPDFLPHILANVIRHDSPPTEVAAGVPAGWSSSPSAPINYLLTISC